MARRAANITQADIARTSRALIACGLKFTRVVTRSDGVVFELVDGSERPVIPAPQEDSPEVIL
jgi:hypothetical protein